MGLFSRKARKVAHVDRFDGPGARAGDKCAYFNIYEYEDGSCRTVEFDAQGRHLHEYDGEPEFPDDAGAPGAADPEKPPKSKPADAHAHPAAKK